MYELMRHMKREMSRVREWVQKQGKKDEENEDILKK
jgi:hypothetical protein